MSMGFDEHPAGSRWIGVGVIVALHAFALWGLWSHRFRPFQAEATTLLVSFIATPALPQKEEPRRETAKPRPLDQSQLLPLPQPLAALAPVSLPSEVVAAAPSPPAPLMAPTAAVAQVAAGPVMLGSELSASCPDRPAPAYPAISRRKGEEGSVVLRVELNEQGHVTAARIVTASGYQRLDEAALAAVMSWRCLAAQRNGQAARAVALQPFNFVLQGN